MGLLTIKTDDIRRLTARYSTPDYIEKGRVQDLSMPIYLNGGLVTPTSGTITIYSASVGGTEDPILAESACAIENDVAIYSLVAADTEDLDLDDNWTEKWSLVFTVSGEPITVDFRREAGLVLNRLYPVITDTDLTRIHKELRDWQAADQRSYQSYIDQAWDEIQGKLLENGNRVNLILSAYALRSAHLDLSLFYVFLDYSSSTGVGGKYDKISEMYLKKFEKDWDRIQFRYNVAEDGLSGQDKQNADPVVYLNQAPRWTYTTGTGGY